MWTHEPEAGANTSGRVRRSAFGDDRVVGGGKLLVAVGCVVVEGRGSQVRFVKDGMIETFHRPHPAKVAKRYQVAAARAFLLGLGVKP